MSIFTKLIYLVVAVVIGLSFVFWPKQNTPYLGPQPDNGTCENVDPNTKVAYPADGIKETGFPLVYQTVYSGHCTVSGTSISKVKAEDDFVIGFVGTLLAIALAMVLKKVISKS